MVQCSSLDGNDLITHLTHLLRIYKTIRVHNGSLDRQAKLGSLTYLPTFTAISLSDTPNFARGI
jgi:hypothetical protein